MMLYPLQKYVIWFTIRKKCNNLAIMSRSNNIVLMYNDTSAFVNKVILIHEYLVFIYLMYSSDALFTSLII